MSSIHWFFSFGTMPARALYRLSKSSSGELSCRQFVTPALLELGWPVAAADLARTQLRLFGTKDLFQFQKRANGVPAELFLGEVASVAPKLRDSLERTLAEAQGAPLVNRQEQDIWRVVDGVLRVPDGDEVVIELTNGIRSVTTGLLLAAGLLRAMRPGVRLLAVSYAEFGAERRAFADPGAAPPGCQDLVETDGCVPISPVIDMLPFLRLFEWTSAVTAMAGHLDPKPLVDLARSAAADLRRARHGGGAPLEDATDVIETFNALRNLGPSLALGWPRDVGAELARWSPASRQLDEAGELLSGTDPAAAQVLQYASDLLQRQLGSDFPDPDQLSERRLVFDLRLARFLGEIGRHGDALRLLREWFVNAVLLARGREAEWLDLRARAEAEVALHTSSRRRRDDAIGALWARVTAARNAASHGRFAAHHDVKPTTIARTVGEVPDIVAAAIGVDLRCANPAPLNLSPFGQFKVGGAAGCTLVAPLGQSPGVVFSALRLVRPSRVCFITSKEASAAVGEILARAEFRASPAYCDESVHHDPDAEVVVWEASDPFLCFREAHRARELLQDWVLRASDVVLSMTGGTTALGHVAATVASVHPAIRRAVLLDRRKPEEQRSNPWKEGELEWLEDDGG